MRKLDTCQSFFGHFTHFLFLYLHTSQQTSTNTTCHFQRSFRSVRNCMLAPFHCVHLAYLPTCALTLTYWFCSCPFPPFPSGAVTAGCTREHTAVRWNLWRGKRPTFTLSTSYSFYSHLLSALLRPVVFLCCYPYAALLLLLRPSFLLSLHTPLSQFSDAL